MIDKIRKNTDKVLNELLEDMKQKYKDKVKWFDRDIDLYFKSLEKQDEEKRKKVKSGEITETEYRDWKLLLLEDASFRSYIERLAMAYVYTNEYIMDVVNEKMIAIYLLSYNMSMHRFKRNIEIDDPDIEEEELQKQMNKKKDFFWNLRVITSKLVRYMIMNVSFSLVFDMLIEECTRSIMNSVIRNAITMTNRAENQARFDANEQISEDFGVKRYKTWITVGDERVRESHEGLDGMTIPIDEPFPNGLMYPCDPSGTPEETCNCRCWLDYSDRRD